MHVVFLYLWVWDQCIVLELVDVSDEDDGCLCVWHHRVWFVYPLYFKNGSHEIGLPWLADYAEVEQSRAADGEDSLHCDGVECQVKEICGLKQQWECVVQDTAIPFFECFFNVQSKPKVERFCFL